MSYPVILLQPTDAEFSAWLSTLLQHYCSERTGIWSLFDEG